MGACFCRLFLTVYEGSRLDDQFTDVNINTVRIQGLQSPADHLEAGWRLHFIMANLPNDALD